MIIIFTPYSFDPIHPRLEQVENTLIKNNYKINKYNLSNNSRIYSAINLLLLRFFHLQAIIKSIYVLWRERKLTRIVYIQDMKYLPISLFAKLLGKKVVYETLDDNVELNYYQLTRRYDFLKKCPQIKRVARFVEKSSMHMFCDQVIVNSQALKEYLNSPKVNLIFYTSPFENRFYSNVKKKGLSYI